MNSRRILEKGLLASCSLAIVLQISLGSQSTSAEFDAINSQVTRMAPLDCVVSPHKIVDLSSATPGVIQTLMKERSDFVQQGEIAVQLNAEVEKASVALAQARAGIQSELKVGKINLDYAQKQVDRVASLHDRSAVSMQQKDEADRERDLSQWQLQQAYDQAEIRTLELARAEKLLAQKTIRSPISGFVVKNFKSIGEHVDDEPILRIAQLNPLNIDAVVPMTLFGEIELGMRASVQLENLQYGMQYAEVTRVDKVGDVGSGTFGIRLSLDNPDHTIPAGLKCDLSFESSVVDNNHSHENRAAATETAPGLAHQDREQAG